eukprot:4043570-Pleurochrysis_carterae.AAC.4
MRLQSYGQGRQYHIRVWTILKVRTSNNCSCGIPVLAAAARPRSSGASTIVHTERGVLLVCNKSLPDENDSKGKVNAAPRRSGVKPSSRQGAAVESRCNSTKSTSTPAKQLRPINHWNADRGRKC